MKKEISEEQLISYISGELNKTQIAEVEEWYAQSKENQKLLEQIYYIMFVSDRLKAVKDVDVEKSLQQFKTRINRKKKLRSLSLTKLSKSVIPYAAILILALLGTFLIVNFLHDYSKEVCEVIGVPNSKNIIVLPDKSIVSLKPGSKIIYPTHFTEKNRNVELEGEAYFDVTKQNGKKFTVTVGATRIIVKGTRFNVIAYKLSNIVEAVLYSGAINFEVHDQKVEMKPNQKIIYDTQSQRINVYNTSDGNGRWTFNMDPLEEVARNLREIYTKEFEFINDSIAGILFTGTVDSTNSLQHTLEVITLTTETKFRIDDDKIVISK